MADEEVWTPKTRDDWVGIFADGIGADRERRKKAEEEEAERVAKEQAANGGGEGNGDQRPRSVADRILGR
jgi:hypothetical protein